MLTLAKITSWTFRLLLLPSPAKIKNANGVLLSICTQCVMKLKHASNKTQGECLTQTNY